jgi:nifR3 family TIM-barrel protein
LEVGFLVFSRDMLSPITIFNERFGPIRYLMAPMAGITDVVFRSLIREMGAEAVVSELISCEGLIRGGKKTWELMAFDETERPVGIQIFGAEIPKLVEAARIVQGEGADFVDINLGCPVKKVVCDGGGAAWLRDPVALGKLLTEMKKVLRIPLTIKVRTGWDENSRNVADVVRVAAESGVAWVAIHGRTRAQGYSGLADWELIRQVAGTSAIPIIGNGDIITANDAKSKIEEGFAHAVMIGRGALKNPWIFREIQGRRDGNYDFIKLIDRHFALAIAKKDRTRAFLSIKKFLAWYAAGYPYCSNFRSQIFQTHDIDELHTLALDYFRDINHTPKVDDGQPFLMGGHG